MDMTVQPQIPTPLHSQEMQFWLLGKKKIKKKTLISSRKETTFPASLIQPVAI